MDYLAMKNLHSHTVTHITSDLHKPLKGIHGKLEDLRTES